MYCDGEGYIFYMGRDIMIDIYIFKIIRRMDYRRGINKNF